MSTELCATYGPERTLTFSPEVKGGRRDEGRVRDLAAAPFRTSRLPGSCLRPERDVPRPAARRCLRDGGASAVGVSLRRDSGECRLSVQRHFSWTFSWHFS